jgi:hypothetical protein
VNIKYNSSHEFAAYFYISTQEIISACVELIILSVFLPVYF